MAIHNELGNWGEQQACKVLQKKGYKILANNWRYKHTEIDIVAAVDNLIIIVEVKTRSSNFFGNPEEFISKSKIKNLLKATNAYIEKYNIDLEIRFDIIAITKNSKTTKINHIKEAFYPFI